MPYTNYEIDKIIADRRYIAIIEDIMKQNNWKLSTVSIVGKVSEHTLRNWMFFNVTPQARLLKKLLENIENQSSPKIYTISGELTGNIDISSIYSEVNRLQSRIFKRIDNIYDSKSVNIELVVTIT